MTGWGTSRGYKYSGAAGGRCCGAAMQKNARCARVFVPRGALAFAFSGHFPPIIFLANLPGVRTAGSGGSPGHVRRFPPPFALLSYPRSHLSPLTPSDGHASRPRRGPQRTKATDASSPQPRFSLIFSILIFFLSPLERRSSDLSITCILGQYTCTTTRTKHVFPRNAPEIAFFTQNTISRCQGNSRSGRPVAVYGAPLRLLRVSCPV
jgi:hypothetical protein